MLNKPVRVYDGTWISHESYARGTREWFAMAMDNPHPLGMAMGRRVPTGQTVYDISYSITPSRAEPQ